MSDVTELRPGQSAGHPPVTGRASRMRPGRTLGRVVSTYEDIWEAYRQCRRLGREYSVTGHLDGWCIRKWIDLEV